MARAKSGSSNYGGRFRAYAKCGSMVARDASTALAMVRKLKRLINVEYKTLNTILGDTTPTTTAAIGHLTNLAQGDDVGNRDGLKVKAFSIQLKGQVKMHETATATSTRILLFIDHANQGAPPSRALLFSTEGEFFRGQTKITEPQMNQRFTILYDKIILQSDSGNKLTRINFYKKLHHHVTFTGSSATEEGIGTIWVMTASSEATNTPALDVTSTFKWIDN